MKIFISLGTKSIKLFNLKIDFSYEVFNLAATSVFECGVFEGRPALDRLSSLEFDYIESVACKHDWAFFAIAYLFVGLGLEYPVGDWLFGMVGTSCKRSVFEGGVLSDVALVMILRLSVIVTHIHVIIVNKNNKHLKNKKLIFTSFWLCIFRGLCIV